MGIDVEEFKKKPSASEELQILFVGRIARVRKIELLLQAVNQLSFSFHLTIAGGEEKNQPCHSHGLSERTKTTYKTIEPRKQSDVCWKKTPQELKTLYQSADIFVYQSLYENFGQPLLEAAAHGPPLISTSVGIET